MEGILPYYTAILANKLPDTQTDGTYNHMVTGVTSIFNGNTTICILTVDFRMTTPTTLAVVSSITRNYPIRRWEANSNVVSGIPIKKVYGVL